MKEEFNSQYKDSQVPNPLIRALVFRTIGCFRVDKITEYLCVPLQRMMILMFARQLPYVLLNFMTNAELVEDRGFLDSLKNLISDHIPMVVANAVAALSEIQEHSCRPIFEITPPTLSKLLTALMNAEWGQVFILDSLSRYKAGDAREAENIVERVTPRLQHANCAVVLLVVKNLSAGPPDSLLQVAVNQQPVWYFNDKILLHVFFVEDGRMERTSFLETWSSIPDSNEVQKEFQALCEAQKRQSRCVLLLCQDPSRYKLTTVTGSPGVKCAIKTPNPEMAPMFFESIESLLMS
ncbi:UDP-glucose 4-epimerase family protein [Hibiscus syriacus]|uniref:UDP-glucose 4-epimerase family protein n=1 Tax=Hibiscus syriacus TaxID=106335 RepID=A0A6A3A4Q6_HIBSY|nr:UDP-glucose 4-epimerase family protein [Hibiscus syriacus]